MHQVSSVKFLFHDNLTHAWSKSTLAFFFFAKFANYVKTLKSKD